MRTLIAKDNYKDILELYTTRGLSDKAISNKYKCSEDVIRSFRKRHAIRTNDFSSYRRRLIDRLTDTQFIEIILNNNYKSIQKILGVSSTIWKGELKKRNIDLKNKLRINSYPKLDREQEILVVGGLLGDGCIERSSLKCSRYSEAHAPNQLLYLQKKNKILKPYSCPIYLDESHINFPSYRFTTISHPNFTRYRDLFYSEDLKGKLIPVDFLKDVWHDDILAYWYLDDGHYDVKSGCFTISNKCPNIEQLKMFLEFLSTHYEVPFTMYTDPDLYTVKIPLKFRDRFMRIIQKVSTEDMCYKSHKSYLELKPIVVSQSFEGSPRIIDIKNKISMGYTHAELQEEYPITERLFKRLGGSIPKYTTVNHPLVKEIVEKEIKEENTDPVDTEVIIGTLLGDGNIYVYGKDTNIFSFAHSEPQMSYIKLKYELLKQYVNRVLYLKNTTNDYYSFHVFLKSLTIFSEYHSLFYTANKYGKSHPQKYLFKKEIIDLMTPKVFAFWIMDDGKKYGKDRYAFSVTIGKQPYYNYEDFKKFVMDLNDRLGIDMRAREEKISYEITTSVGTAEKVFEKIKDHIWPYFSYKFSALVSDCGMLYRDYSWFSEWSSKHAPLCNMR